MWIAAIKSADGTYGINVQGHYGEVGELLNSCDRWSRRLPMEG
jgi:hypothetical protein